MGSLWLCLLVVKQTIKKYSIAKSKVFIKNNSKMACCGRNYVKTASTIGKVSIMLTLITCLQAFSIKDTTKMAGELSGCISNILLSVILVYGAEKRNRAALLVWIILQTIGLTVVVLFSISIGFLVAFGFIGDVENFDPTFSDENYALPDDRHGILRGNKGLFFLDHSTLTNRPD